MLQLAKEEGVELTDDQLEAVTGGFCSTPTRQCPKCGGTYFDWGESAGLRRYYCNKCGILVYEVYNDPSK